MRLRFSDKMHDVLGFTAEEALRTGWRAAGVDHLMLGLLRHRDNDACRALTESGIDPGDLKRSLDEHLFRPEPLNFGEPETVHPTRAAAEVIRLSGYEALKHGSGTIRTVHLLLAISLSEGSATLRDVFLGMIGDNRKLLSKVDELKTFYRKGYVGWIGGTRVLVGNRALMQDYDIKIPSLEFEQRHSVNQRRVIYLAASGNLMAMFLVSYQRDPDTAAVLEGLRQAGMSMIVDCDDFNCDVHLIEAVYGLPSGSVKVLSDEERQALDEERMKLEAEAQKVKQASLSEMVLQEMAINKWDGKLPQYFSGDQLPFITLK